MAAEQSEAALTQAGRVVVHLPAKSVRSCLVGIELQCLLLRLAAKILRHLHAVGRITRFREKEIISAPVDRLKLGRINPPVDHPTGEAVAVLELGVVIPLLPTNRLSV